MVSMPFHGKKSNFLIYDWDSVYGAFAQNFSSIINTRFDLYKKKLLAMATFHLGSSESTYCIENRIFNSSFPPSLLVDY